MAEGLLHKTSSSTSNHRQNAKACFPFLRRVNQEGALFATALCIIN
jgi:hypothetical protein